jgi:hypothetical protein
LIYLTRSIRATGGTGEIVRVEGATGRLVRPCIGRDVNRGNTPHSPASSVIDRLRLVAHRQIDEKLALPSKTEVSHGSGRPCAIRAGSAIDKTLPIAPARPPRVSCAAEAAGSSHAVIDGENAASG